MSEWNRERSPRQTQGGSRLEKKKKRRGGVAVVVAAVVVCLGVLVVTSMGSGGDGPAGVSSLPLSPTASPSPSAQTQVSPSPSPTPTPTPVPTPAPTPTPYDYSRSAPASEAVGMEYFADAVFIGDSRTDGLQLYSGIKGTTFLSYKGITVFDVMEREDKKVVEIDGKSYTILEALGMGSYAKVYVALGVNELGYQNSQSFVQTYGQFIDKVRELQPGAEIYVQSLVPVNPEKCKASGQPNWLNNEGIASYNTALQAMCQEKEVIYLNISEALVDEQGILPADATVDGLHFTKAWYKKWLEYLMTHTVHQ